MEEWVLLEIEFFEKFGNFGMGINSHISLEEAIEEAQQAYNLCSTLMRRIDTYGKIADHIKFLSIFSSILRNFLKSKSLKAFSLFLSNTFPYIFLKAIQVCSRRNRKRALLLIRILYEKIYKNEKPNKLHKIDLYLYHNYKEDPKLIANIKQIYTPMRKLLSDKDYVFTIP